MSWKYVHVQRQECVWRDSGTVRLAQELSSWTLGKSRTPELDLLLDKGLGLKRYF